MQIRRWLAITGASVLLLAAGTPAFKHWVLGASGSLSLGLLWVVLFAASVLAGVAALLLAMASGSGRVLCATRGAVQVAVLGLLVIHVFYLADVTQARIIAPSSEVIVPDGYSGTLGIRIRNPVEPGRDTIGKTYVYTVPQDGFVDAGPGWIAASFRFDREGTSLPQLYATRMRWARGEPLRYHEFACTWADPARIDALVSQPSASRTLAMACSIRPGATGGTSIDGEEANRFFRAHAAPDPQVGGESGRQPPAAPARP